MEQIEEGSRRCKVVLNRITTLPRHTNISDSSKRTLHKLALSEFNFLSHASSTAPLCINIGHLEAVIHLLEQPFITGVSRVCKLLPFSNAIIKTVHVDIVCSINKNPVWIIVSDRNPKCVSWFGNVHKGKGLKERLEQVIVAAQSSQLMKPTSIVLFFSHGVVDSLFEKLRNEFGACDMELELSSFDYECCEELDGEWINVIARSYNEARMIKIDVGHGSSGISSSKCRRTGLIVDSSELQFVEEDSKLDLNNSAFHSFVCSLKPWSIASKSEELGVPVNLREADDIINFTTTALIALVSGISNGCTEKLLATPETELRQKFKGNLEFIIGQVKSEIENPMLMECGKIISGKRGIVCETVFSEFKELISMYGGPHEKFRACELLKRLRTVADAPSERVMGLPTTRNLALKNKVVFGTGDHWHATTLTANMAFVRAVSQTGMSLVTIEHSPRALIGD